MMQYLKIPNIGGGGMYLGLPEQFGRKKKEMLQYIQNKIKQKISGWKTRFLTTDGKETLIKVVAYAMPMPVYSMYCFQRPKELYGEIDSAVSRFWWGSNIRQPKTLLSLLEKDGNVKTRWWNWFPRSSSF